jgi:hypothetical protein
MSFVAMIFNRDIVLHKELKYEGFG